MKKHSLEEARRAAAAKKGECLSTEYISIRSRLLWKCHLGHKWASSLLHILEDKWCPECAKEIIAVKRTKHTIEEMQVLARNQEGECLSSEYKGSREKLRWRCKSGHEWNAYPKNIIQGRWCPTCSPSIRGRKIRKYSIQNMQNLARSRGGDFLSETFSIVQCKYRWRCKRGHEWEAKAYEILYGSWCKVCHNEEPRVSKSPGPVSLEAIAAERGGKYLTPEITTSKSIGAWRCSRGHEWKIRLKNVLSYNLWCPVCARRAFSKENDGIIFSDYFIIIPKEKFGDFRKKIVVVIPDETMDIYVAKSEVASKLGDIYGDILVSLRGIRTGFRTCIWNGDPSSLVQIYSILGDIQDDFDQGLITSDLVRSHIQFLKDCLAEINGNDVTPVIAMLLLDSIKHEKARDFYQNFHATIWSILHPNEHRPYIINPHWVVMSKSYFNQLVWTAKDRLQNPLASSRLDLLFMFGNVFSAIRNHVSGIHPHSPLIVSKDEDVDIDSFFPVTAVSFKDKSIPRHLLDHLIDCARKFESQFEDIDGGNILIAYSGLIKDSFPSISIQTLRFWMEKSEKTLIHDPFTEENVHDHAWLLGAMLGETSITLDPPSALVQIGYSNPLLVLDFLIPRYQLSGDLHFVIKLSPPFVDWLTKVSALGPAGKRNLSFTNNFAEIDEFIAGFMDVHLTIASKYSRIAVSLPLENVSEWLSVMPRPIPVDILGNGIIVEGLKHHSVTWYPAEKPCVKGYFFGRRYNDTIFDTEDQAITHIVTNLKYLYERVLPHCTHPRLERLFFAAQDIEDHFGGEREQDSYACRLRRKLSEMGGINTRELQDTLSRPVLDPDTGNVLIYKPKWLIRRMKEKNCTDADIFASLARHGPFIPFSIGWKGDAVKP